MKYSETLAVECGPPPEVADAQITDHAGGTQQGAIVQYDCNECYQGGGSVQCQANGIWTSTPECSCNDLTIKTDVFICYTINEE